MKHLQNNSPRVSTSQSKKMLRTKWIHKTHTRFSSTTQTPILQKKDLYMLFQKVFTKLVSNPLFLVVFFLRIMYNLYHHNFVEIVYSFIVIMSFFVVTTLLGEWLMQVKWIKQHYETFQSDDQHLETYWQKNLKSVAWFFRFAYLVSGVVVFFHVAGFFGGYAFSNGMLVAIEPEHVGMSFAGVGFGLGGFLSTAMAELVVQTSVAYMLPAVEAPLMQTCRYCVDKFGKVTIVCFGGAYMLNDVPLLQNTVPVDAARMLLGKPLLESSTGHIIYANLRPLIESGEVDINLLTDPKTGRLSDDLMVHHCKTTYKGVISKRCAPWFVTTYASPENVVYTGIKNLSSDTVNGVSSWARKTFSWGKK